MTRQEAVEILNNKGFTFCNFERCVDFYTALNCERCEEALKMAIEALEQEPKRGKWIEDGCYPYYKCNNCGQVCGEQSNGVEKEPLFTKYCPNCGVKMESEE